MATVASDVQVTSDQLASVMARSLDYVAAIDFESLTESTIPWGELAESTIVDSEMEAMLFRQMNLAFREADGIRQQLDSAAPDPLMVLEVERLIARAERIRNALATIFVKLANSIARGFVTQRMTFDELASEAHTTLLYAISKFNPDRGFRFSTYATHAIRRRLYRYLRSPHHQAEINVDWTGHEPEGRGWSYAYQRQVEQSIRDVDRLLLRLSARERYVIRSRFGWGRDFNPTTLQALANELGVSRERVRQVEARALQKLREG